LSTDSQAHWDASAAGWIRRTEQVRELGAPVSHWLIEAIEPQPGQQLLELAAGLGETGFLAAELIRPGGTLISSDQSEGMLEGGRARAAELGLDNVEFRVLVGEWIDLPVASVDAVLCRWGYMLMPDPLAALRETRRVLRPGGRVALAVWDDVMRNPWAAVPAGVLIQRGLTSPPEPGTPGPFALGDAARVEQLLAEAGFSDIVVDALDIEQRHPSLDRFWETTLDLSKNFADAIAGVDEEGRAEVRAALASALETFTAEDGALRIPGRTLVAAASA
jgi:SAM-dependent methyltransferase